MVEVMKLDIHASEQDVLTGTLAKLQEQEARTGAEKVDRLMQQYRGRGLAVLAPSPKWWSSSDGRDIGKYGKVSGAAPVGPGIRPLRALEFRIERVVSDPFQVGSIRQTQEIRSASRVGHRPPSANVRASGVIFCGVAFYLQPPRRFSLAVHQW